MLPLHRNDPHGGWLLDPSMRTPPIEKADVLVYGM